jgi:hypothetical protein
MRCWTLFGAKQYFQLKVTIAPIDKATLTSQYRTARGKRALLSTAIETSEKLSERLSGAAALAPLLESCRAAA